MNFPRDGLRIFGRIRNHPDADGKEGSALFFFLFSFKPGQITISLRGRLAGNTGIGLVVIRRAGGYGTVSVLEISVPRKNAIAPKPLGAERRKKKK